MRQRKTVAVAIAALAIAGLVIYGVIWGKNQKGVNKGVLSVKEVVENPEKYYGQSITVEGKLLTHVYMPGGGAMGSLYQWNPSGANYIIEFENAPTGASIVGGKTYRVTGVLGPGTDYPILDAKSFALVEP